jgi:MYXO-CTERM domain-containing protein
MSKITMCAAGLAAVLSSTAMADQVLNLGNNTLTGGNFNEYQFNLSGSLTGFSINFDYVTGGGGSWASDMLLLIIDPNGAGQYWGGFNVSPAGYTDSGIWGFDGSASANSGNYGDSKSVAGLSGNGTWTFRVYNGWSTAPSNQYNNFVLSAKGVVPAPGAIALLGLAGLAGRRRRSA